MKLITTELIDNMIKTAAGKPRKRINHNVHEESSDVIQRMFVAAQSGSYFRPHRHPGKWEFAIVTHGLFTLLVFNEDGCVTERVEVGPEAATFGFELPADVWHSWIPMTDNAVFLEVKQGPYDPATAAEFASWAPEEGSPEVEDFMNKLKDMAVGEHAKDFK